MRSSKAWATLVSVLLVVRAHGSEERQCDRASESCQLDQLDVEGPTEVMQNKTSISTDAVQASDPKKLGLLFLFAGLVLLWIGTSIKWAVDGSLPARLALWGLLPEAFAAISVPAVVALLRLKRETTPVLLLRAAVDKRNAQQLGEALRVYGKKAELQALELPYNPEMGEEGLQQIVEGLSEAELALEELDLSYNPQLGAASLTVTKPLWTSLSMLRLVDCGLQEEALKGLASEASKLKINILDLSGNCLTGAGETLAEVMEAPLLEDLAVANCALSLEDLRHIAEELAYTSLRSLQLAGNNLMAVGVEVLSDHLPKCRITNLGLERNALKCQLAPG